MNIQSISFSVANQRGSAYAGESQSFFPPGRILDLIKIDGDDDDEGADLHPTSQTTTWEHESDSQLWLEKKETRIR